MKKDPRWFFSVDRGGTFTDVIGSDPEGRVHALKLLSRSSRYSDASIEGIRGLLGLGPRLFELAVKKPDQPYAAVA